MSALSTIPHRLARTAMLVVAAAAALSSPRAASAADADGKKYDDEKFQFSLTVPEPWAEAALEGYTVPGTARSAWSGPSNASVIAFVQEPGKAFTPRFLVDESAKAVREKLGCEVKTADVKTVSGKKAMWLVATGKGTGGALTGQGDVPTTTHWVAVPREKDIVILLLTCPAADYEARLPSFEKAVKSLEVKGTQTAEQSESK